eukprot:TRINITY_DN2089_c0_g1_i19.p2 TRINITY_DN2089_c0_g1~~TRINITY_DN2089_c0_g1_i19.p2  ORF type:complete len:369 (-),score=64.25 TRINITY_DN2089_c0_g1_i19:1913-2944(-)
MDYNMLKNILKDILHYRQQRIPPSPAAGGGGGGLKRKMTMYRAFSGLTRRYSNLRGGGGGEEQVILVNSAAADGDGVRSSERYETMFLMATVEGGEYEMVYFKRLDDEFNKVNSFYMSKVQEVMAEADALTRQMNALIAFRLRVENPSRYHQGFLASSPSPNSGNTIPDLDLDLLPTPTNTSRLEKAARMDVIQEVEMSSEITEESVIHVDEPHNHKSARQKKPHKKSSKPAPLEVLDHVKINVALETPRSTIKGMRAPRSPSPVEPSPTSSHRSTVIFVVALLHSTTSQSIIAGTSPHSCHHLRFPSLLSVPLCRQRETERVLNPFFFSSESMKSQIGPKLG